MTIEKPCLFCQTEFQAGRLAENEFFYIVADQNPVAPGHLLIIPKRHVATIFELDEKEFASLQKMLIGARSLSHSETVKEFYQKLAVTSERAKTREFCQLALDNWDKEITGYNVGINNGESAGQTIFHLHVHLIPRFWGDVENPVGGVRFVIPQLANYR